MNIYAIRHGLTELNKQGKINGQIDEPLAPEGFAQVQAFVSFVPKSITHIYTSSQLRAKQTAEILGRELHLPIFVDKRLREVHMGSVAGQSWDSMEGGSELKRKYRTVQFDFRPYGGESVADVKKRVLAFLKKINNKYGRHQVLIVTHGGIIRLLHLFNHGEVVYETEKQVSLLTFDLKKILQGHGAT